MTRTIGKIGYAAGLIAGGLVGTVTGAIVSVNILIFSGITDGYEADVGQVFDEKPPAGVLVAGALLVGPIVGGGRRKPRVPTDRW